MVRRKESDAKALVMFFSQSGRLKSEKRRGWLMKLGLAHPESVADHSYRTALMALVMSDSRGLDTAKAVRLALLHDLPEALVGDAMPEERSGASKVTAETKAMEELLEGLPPKVRSLYRDTWLEFLGGKTEEARRWLDKAQSWLDQFKEGMPARAEQEFGLDFHNWLEAHVLRREAEALIQPAEKR